MLYQKNESMPTMPTTDKFDFVDGSLGTAQDSHRLGICADHDPKWVRDINYDSYAESSSPSVLFANQDQTWFDHEGNICFLRSI